MKELEWAQIYHDSIRGKTSIEALPLNVGRWAGNYTFFYLLNRILTDFKPKKIIEFGLGESTKFISIFIDNYLKESTLKTIEHDDKWTSLFLENFKISKQVDIQVLSLVENEVHENITYGYNNVENVILEIYDLYIIDGPFGTPKYSRYDIVNLASKFNSMSRFIILMDDYDRNGEKQTAQELVKIFKSKDIEVFAKEYIGNKSVFLIATKQYKHIMSL
ncbi:hypothetical protein [Hyunsoonleella ulvae]|uniref:hypothetical protein n=1 Tax=Hyunsoonleella ulvae TaxID=2799948 RepID=UPI00193A9222|nr:hypothetical protein [Hyunsoonleella ulvae]